MVSLPFTSPRVLKILEWERTLQVPGWREDWRRLWRGFAEHGRNRGGLELATAGHRRSTLPTQTPTPQHFVFKPASVFTGHSYVHALYFMFEMGGHYTDIYYAFQTF